MNKLKERKVSETQVHIAELMLPEHANPAGNVHGGTIMKFIDNAAFIAASRHTRSNCVTASVDRINFISPVYIGNVVSAKASVNIAFSTSMEVGVKIEAECLMTGVKTHVASAYLTYVALDEDDSPKKIPELVPETDEEKRRFNEAQKRREDRLETKKKRDNHHHDNQDCMIRPSNS